MEGETYGFSKNRRQCLLPHLRILFSSCSHLILLTKWGVSPILGATKREARIVALVCSVQLILLHLLVHFLGLLHLLSPALPCLTSASATYPRPLHHHHVVPFVWVRVMGCGWLGFADVLKNDDFFRFLFSFSLFFSLFQYVSIFFLFFSEWRGWYLGFLFLVQLWRLAFVYGSRPPRPLPSCSSQAQIRASTASQQPVVSGARPGSVSIPDWAWQLTVTLYSSLRRVHTPATTRCLCLSPVFIHQGTDRGWVVMGVSVPVVPF